MGLSWQQGPLSMGAVGRFLVPNPMPKRLLYAEPLRRRMRVRFGETWIADSEQVLLLFEPGRYPVAYFPESDIDSSALQLMAHTTRHADLGPTSWYSVRVGERTSDRAAWQHSDLPDYASELQGRVAFAWRAMDAFFEEDERIIGHAADPYHRIDIRQTSRRLTVTHQGRAIADTTRALVVYESGFAPRWYVPRVDINESELIPVATQTFCPYKGVCSYYDVDDSHLAAWYYPAAYPEVRRIENMVSFQPDRVMVHLDGTQLHLDPGQTVIPHGPDRDITVDEVRPGRKI